MYERPLTPPEPKEKCYKFKATAYVTIEGYVWAKSRDEARDLINDLEYEEIEKYNVDEINDINEIEVE